MPEIVIEDATLHVEIDGEGEPVTVLAHGLTNSCRELAMLTPFVQGTKVRFCFRGHGHSSSPVTGYRFADFGRDLDAVAGAYGATAAVGTSLGAGAIAAILQDHPDRFERLVLLLPAGLDMPFRYKDRMLHSAELIDGKSKEEAIEAVLSDPERVANYVRAPWLRDFDQVLLAELNPVGVPRAIREVIEDWPLRDRHELRSVTAPTLIVCRRGDVIHPHEIGEALVEIMPNAELIMFEDGDDLYRGIPMLVGRVAEFLAA